MCVCVCLSTFSPTHRFPQPEYLFAHCITTTATKTRKASRNTVVRETTRTICPVQAILRMPKIQICANDEAKYLHDANADNDLYIWIKFHAIKSKLNHSITPMTFFLHSYTEPPSRLASTRFMPSSLWHRCIRQIICHAIYISCTTEKIQIKLIEITEHSLCVRVCWSATEEGWMQR